MGLLGDIYTLVGNFRSFISNNVGLQLSWETSLPNNEGMLHLYIDFKPQVRLNPNDSTCNGDCGVCLVRYEDSKYEVIEK